MAQKTVRFNQAGINKLPNDKPVVYRIQTEGSKTNYLGVAQRGRVQARLQEHLAGAKDAVPGSKVQIQQAHSIDTAIGTEALAIARTQPKYNKQGK
jgi:predicted GIY-YIG superfamily endonuclease